MRTPNRDALARQSVVFTRHFGRSAPCGPARNLAAEPAHAGLLAEARDRMLPRRIRHADRGLTHLPATPAGLADRRG